MLNDSRQSYGRAKKRNCRKSLKKHFCEYCECTSIHGFQYLGEQERTYFEKIWWIITIACSLSMCLYLISLTYLKWVRSPVIVSFATEQTPIWQIPFPSVTICPETKARQSHYNLTEMYREIILKNNTDVSDIDRLHLEYVSLVCEFSEQINFKHKTLDDEMLDFLKNISAPLENVMVRCKWLGYDIDCKDLFTPIWTEQGVCFNFNMLDRHDLYTNYTKVYENFLDVGSKSDWSLFDGYKSKEVDVYPRRALFPGAKSGLEVELYAEDKDLDYLCNDCLQGYKVSLMHPAQVPLVSEQYFRVPLNQSIVASVKPVMMTTSYTLQTYDSTLRKCYFPHEKKLHFFNSYTEDSCVLECLSNYTYYHCGCVNIHMPRHESVSLCGAASSECMINAENMLISHWVDLEEESEIMLEQFMFKPNETTYGDRPEKCDCLPGCMTLDYDIETSQNDFPWTKIREGAALDKYESEQSYMSHLTIFFKNSQFIKSERNELYGTTDFLANCGGLLGLFTGFSVISFVEIIYHLTVRWICTSRINKNKTRIRGA